MCFPVEEVGKKNHTCTLKMELHKMGLSKNGQFGNITLFFLCNLHNVLVANESSVSGEGRGEKFNVKCLGLRVEFVYLDLIFKSV